MAEAVEGLAQGLDTSIINVCSRFARKWTGLICFGQGGSMFSAGELQLLCLARALFTSAPILLCDEITATVDEASDEVGDAVDANTHIRHQHGIMQFMHELILRTPATVLAICHRLQTLFRFDYVLVLDQGAVVEFGHPDTLAGSPTSQLSQLLQAANMKPEIDAPPTADDLLL
jgi:ABC-type multidrug transport system fused ATPase/permease subunit